MQQSDIDRVFHPERPITKRGLLVGRDDEVNLALSRLTTLGGHVLLCGHRGIGKTSVARVVENILVGRDSAHIVQYLSCDSTTSFVQIAELLAARSKISLPPTHINSPSLLAGAVGQISGFLLIDEIDRLKAGERVLLAEFMKALSDRGASFSVCVIGIARTALDIFDGHLSVHRCLNEIYVKALPRAVIARLVDDGFALLGLRVRADIVIDIARLSQGFPSNAVAICRHCAECMLQQNAAELRPELFRFGLNNLMKERGAACLDVLRRVLTGDRVQERRAILLAASQLEAEEFSDHVLFEATKKRISISIDLFETLCLGFCIEGTEKVFDILVPGLLRFSDPRMSMIVDITEYLRVERGAVK